VTAGNLRHVDDALLSDLAAENDALDAVVAPLAAGPAGWERPTPAAGWTVADQVHHLTGGNRLAARAVRGEPGTRFAGELTGAPPARPSEPAVLLEAWRDSRAEVLGALAAVDARHRVAWGVAEMTARSLATARLMECWAHGLDCHAALARTSPDTERLRHVAHLSWRALPHAFAVAGEEPPGPLDGLALVLTGPSGDEWRLGAGPREAAAVVSGPAGEWCRVAVRRSAPGSTSLIASGPLAQAALRVARAYV
jgi:uncharacterized protein (TIGR03084 family)